MPGNRKGVAYGQHNIRQIEMLSQRGETLSIVDLVNANTLSVEMAAFLFAMMSDNASFLTAAKPGNAGKTTLMACILMFLPSDTRIVTIGGPSAMAQTPQDGNGSVCYLCHEIGNGPWYGYLWGKHVGEYFKRVSKYRSIASCMHADTTEEMRGILLSDALDVAEEDFRKLDFILFMNLEQKGGQFTRRVSTLYEAEDDGSRNGGGYRPLFVWDRNSDTFHQQGDSLRLQALARKKGMSSEQSRERWLTCEDFLRRLIEQEIHDYRSVYAKIGRFHERARQAGEF